ncbi:Piso0_005798 [Millerozyma farinosa CBS 7064]|uniref:Piso0_005798 protein n=1 Tax=Pichia sorbitophila (strain ATCC MYA-4447 / BCRC 22081 / CBS 7064 / NBRC 10061 / NRRL Y-12695) TaxID=559304 RepID=G8XZZ6_PICSO|nr:Piso0_005798 [Millerozyma farinosa CBS 7064]
MRVKKPTSKRISTRLREGIKKKASAQRRKTRKLSKKDPTWRSRHKKDPGIPASFPYKDKIIEELEENRRIEKEKKEERRLEKQREREEALARGESVEEIMDVEEDEEDENGLAALVESAQNAAKEYDGMGGIEGSDEESMDDSDDVEYDLSLSENEDAEEVDKSRKLYDKVFKQVVDASDVVLYVLDARDPESTRSRKIEQAVLENPGKRLILILNKVDLIPPHVLNEWLNVLKAQFLTIPVKASTGATNNTSFNKKLTNSMTSDTLLKCLKSYANKSNLKRSIIVGVIGYPNVGKSSIINALTNRHGNHAKACPVGNQAGVTTSLREVKIDNKLKVLDSPGIVFPDDSNKKKNATQEKARLAMLSALPPNQIVDPIPPVTLLLKKFSKDNEMSEGLKKLYALPPVPSTDLDTFVKQFLIHVARSRGRLGKGGVPNLEAAAMTVLNDWKDGRLLGWTVPKSHGSVLSTIENSGSAKSTDAQPNAKGREGVETTIVTSWAKEFDLDGLLGDNFGLEE